MTKAELIQGVSSPLALCPCPQHLPARTRHHAASHWTPLAPSVSVCPSGRSLHRICADLLSHLSVDSLLSEEATQGGLLWRLMSATETAQGRLIVEADVSNRNGSGTTETTLRSLLPASIRTSRCLSFAFLPSLSPSLPLSLSSSLFLSPPPLSIQRGS